MPKPTNYYQSVIEGIADSQKSGGKYSVAFNRAVDFRSDPSEVKLNPKAVKVSGSVIESLPMWFDRACNRIFAYGNNGDIYQQENGVWSLVHTAANSSGNGMAYFGEDSNLYFAQDESIGRLLEACTGSEFYNNFLESEGGEATNTKSLDLEKSSSQGAYVADNANLSITSDLSIEAYCKLESLPDTDEEQVLLSKWNEQSNQRSYRLYITTKSNFFGDGRDGALTISSDTTEAPVDANCTGTSGQTTLTITNAHASFSSIAAGDRVLIHQTRGTGAGQYQFAEVSGYSGGVLTLVEPLTFSPQHSATTSVANKAQVRIVKQHTTVTVSSGKTYSPKAWDGLKGGILAFYANDTYTNSGTVTLLEKGFRGATSVSGTGQNGITAEGSSGLGGSNNNPRTTDNSNGNGGGGGEGDTDEPAGAQGAAGGGGGSINAGSQGTFSTPTTYGGDPGKAVGASDLTTVTLGGGGGSGGTDDTVSGVSGTGGRGSGIAFIFASTISTSSGTHIATGGGGGSVSGSPPSYTGSYAGGGGGGGAGAFLFKCVDASIGSSNTGNGGAGGIGQYSTNGGAGGAGAFHIDYSSSVSGSSTPALTTAIDSDLSSNDGYVLKLQISNNGTSVETFTWDITEKIDTSSWRRYQVTWEDTTSTAIAYINGSSLGSKTGSFTSIYNSSANLAIGFDYSSGGAAQNFYDGLIDDVRLWNDVRTQSELSSKNDIKLIGNEGNLIAYYQYESNLNDSQTNVTANNLTGVNSPTYSSDVPFIGLTTRTDQDLAGENNSAVAGTYTLETSIAEDDAKRVYFIPTIDPQKSIQLKIDTIGTGDWTITVHDGKNRVVASKTISNSELATGFYEITFDSVWRPIVGATYHFHVTSTVADGKVNVKTGETTMGNGSEMYAYFTTHYAILVNDVYHPMAQHLNFLAIGNERYLATLQGGDVYTPNRLTLPAGYRIRCLSYWREYLAIGVWQGTDITDYDKGWIFFWDGISDTYNYYIPVPEGGVNTMFGNRDILSIIAGYTGELLAYNGGGTAQKIKQMPLLETSEYIELAPSSMTMWRTMLTFGANLNTDSANVHQGVYTFGTKNRNYPYSLGFDYPLSIGDQTGTNVKIGAVFPSGQDLYIGWQNQNSYGIDKISVTNDPYSSGTIEYLITDLGRLGTDIYPLIFKADFEPLTSGQSVVLKYKSNRDTSWNILVTEDTEGATEARATISDLSGEIQFAVDIETTISSSPVLLATAFEYDDTSSERRL